MIVINIHEAKAKLSEYLEAVAGGQRVLICKRNQPVAELRAVEAARTEPRPVGVAKGVLAVPETFFDPLPPSVLAAFEGGVDEPFRTKAGEGVARAAERPSTAFGRDAAPEGVGQRGTGRTRSRRS